MAGSEDEQKAVVHGERLSCLQDMWDPHLEDDFKKKNQERNPHDKYPLAIVLVGLCLSSSECFLGLSTGRLTVTFPRSVDVDEATM